MRHLANKSSFQNLPSSGLDKDSPGPGPTGSLVLALQFPKAPEKDLGQRRYQDQSSLCLFSELL